ncbi:MAG: ABC transporter substrate-binding protein [Lachnospiraceae bacterium]|nr:ABC transporter substrate-binding protein [Lachnospiraceae bacterium]
MKKKYFQQILSVMMMAAMMLTGCGSSEEQTIGGQVSPGTSEPTAEAAGSVDTLTIAITKDENTLAPFTYVSGTGLTVNRLVYDTLMTTDAEDEIIPWMVEDDYEVVDFKEYTFTLKEGQKFHNGNPVTAEDIKFSFEYPSSQKVSGQRKQCDKVESIEVIDENTVKFVLKEADINYMRDGFSYIRILDDAVYEGIEDGASISDSIGSGMYKLVEYKTGEYYKLEAVEDYFRGTPKVKHINMPIISDNTAIQQGLLSSQLAASTGSIGIEMIDTFEAVDGMTVYSNPGFAPMILNINNGRAPFDQVDFRNALAYGMDVNTICKTLYGEHALVGTKGAIRSDLSYSQDGLEYVYDTAKAVELLEGLGYTEQKDGIRLDAAGNLLSFEIVTYAGNDLRSRACELIQTQLKEIGIDVQIMTMDMDTADAYIWPDFDVANGRDYDLSTWGWSTSNSLTYLISLCSSDFAAGNYNVCGYVSEKFDKLVAEKLSSVSSMEEMEMLLKELQTVIAEEVPLITIAYADTLQVCNTKMYDGWKAGKGMNVINIFSFVDEQ